MSFRVLSEFIPFTALPKKIKKLNYLSLTSLKVIENHEAVGELEDRHTAF